MVDDLNKFIENQDALVVYFFIRHEMPESSKSRTVIGSIVQQLLRLGHNFTGATKDSGDILGVEEMLALLRDSLSRNSKAYLVIDGLDICGQTDRAEIIDFLCQLQQDKRLFVCASYRQEPNIAIGSLLQSFEPVRTVPVPDNGSEIESFIETELTRRLEAGSLKIGHAPLILEIQDALLGGSKGMFLWVALQIEIICTLQTDEEIRNTLADLPGGLGDIYSRLLQKQKNPVSKYQQRIPELITVAQRPLTTNEIREALSVTLGDTTWTAAKLLNDVYPTLATCGCLLVIEEEEHTVRFFHPTVKQFFLGRYVDTQTIARCHSSMTEIIVTYLSYGIFETTVSTFRIPEIEVGSVPARIIDSTKVSSSSAQDLALRLLKRRKQPNISIGKTVAERTQVNYQPPTIIGLSIDKLLTGLFDKSNISNEHLIWSMAIEENNVELVKLLWSTGRINDGLLHLYSRAICKGHEEIVQTFNNPGMREITTRLLDSSSANMDACLVAFAGSPHAMQKCISHARSTQSPAHMCESGRSPIACAVWGCNMDTFRSLLIENFWGINLGTKHITPIWEATRSENREALERLINTRRVLVGPREKEELLKLAGDGEIHGLLLGMTPTVFKKRPVMQRSKTIGSGLGTFYRLQEGHENPSELDYGEPLTKPNQTEAATR
ncbi:hypothetical protein GQ44DRAFT_770237 [Phaeosphaeriaceae sp. PMI808]|nr:hypothetical protein GQ44DRAFT_770237 [Phaeosphaeriaceae sp. PMI808]